MISLMWASIALQVIGIAILAWGDKDLGGALWAFGVKAWFLSFIALIIERFIT